MRIHHIVAQKSYKAVPARFALLCVGIDVNNPMNLVAIKEKVHWFMHTDTYYLWINGLICTSYYSADDNYESRLANVSMTLATIKAIIMGIDNAIV